MCLVDFPILLTFILFFSLFTRLFLVCPELNTGKCIRVLEAEKILVDWYITCTRLGSLDLRYVS